MLKNKKEYKDDSKKTIVEQANNIVGDDNFN